jgi:hypothetical protein
MYLHKDDLVTILQFMDAFEYSEVELIEDNCSGIGATLEAKLHGVQLNGHAVTVSKMIVDESSW